MAPAGKCGGRVFHLCISLKEACRCGCFTGAPTPASSFDPTAALQLQNFTLADVDKLLESIDNTLNTLASTDAAKASGSHSTINKIIFECQQQGEVASSFVETLPKALTKEIKKDIEGSLLLLLKEALGGLGGVHWVGMGLSLIAWSIGNIDRTSQNRKDFLDLLKQVVFLLSNTRTLVDKEEIKENHYHMQAVQENVQVALECALICTSTLREDCFRRFFKAPNQKEAIKRLEDNLGRALEKNTAVRVEHLSDSATERPHQCLLVEKKMVGGEETVEKAMKILEAKSDNIVGLGLHGMGGIGKSTAGLRIFGKFQKMEYNCCRVELAIDITKAGLPKIQKEIIEKLSKCCIAEFSSVEDGRGKMEEQFRDGRKPLFLYIDNVMVEQHLSELLPASACFPPGSRILITTRNQSIVDEFKGLKIKHHRIAVGKLNPQEAKELFWQQFEEGISTSNERSCEAFQKLEEDVIRHCDGLPLALTTVGRYIANSECNPLDSKLWNEVIKAMQKAQPLGGEEEDPLYARIKHVSIDGLVPSVRRSFVDIAFFGEGLEWDTAERLVGKLHMAALHRYALVEKEDRPAWRSRYYGGSTSLTKRAVKVHDVIRSIGVEMARNDKAEFRIEGNDEFQRNIGSLENVVGLKSVRVHEPQLLRRMGRLRVLIDVDLSEQYKTGELISRAEYEKGEFKELVVAKLRSHTYLTFCVGACPELKELSSQAPFDFKVLGGSTQLEVLAIDCYSRALKNLEEIGCLTELRVLKLFGAHTVEELPEAIASCTGLKTLDLEGCEELLSLPEKIFTSCTGLEKLNLCDCESLRSLSDGISNLTGLIELGLRGCESLTSLPDGISNLTGLTELDLSACESLRSLSDGISNLTGLTALGLRKCKSLRSLPDGISNLTGLIELDLWGCESLRSLSDGISNLTGLTELDLSECESLTALPDGISNLTGLTRLVLNGCKSLTSLPDAISNLTGLTRLVLSNCESLTSLPDAISNMTGLTGLGLSRCESLTSLPDGISNLTGLTWLDLRGCKSLTSLPDGIVSNLTALTELELSGCESLTSLSDGISNLTGLTGLCLGSCTSLRSLPDGISNLTGLTWLGLWGCQSLTSLPDRISNLTGLTKLDLRCRSLTSLPDGISNLTGLTRLDLSGCKSLTSLPDGISNLTGLTWLDLSGWESLTSLPDGIISNLTGLTQLGLSECESLTSLPDAISNLTGLTGLGLSECKSLRSLPDGISNLTGFTWLALRGCESLTSLPDGISNLTGLTWIDLSGCKSLTSLPDGISNLTGLTWLALRGCKSVTSLPDGISNLTGLTELVLSGCESLTSLPDGISNLTGLRRLDLSGCESLYRMGSPTCLESLPQTEVLLGKP